MANRIVPWNQGHMHELMHTMRTADRKDLRASTGLMPNDALARSCYITGLGHLWTVLDDENRVVATFGVAEHPHDRQVGIGWLVGSNLITENPIAFGRITKRIIETAEADFDMLYNYVSMTNSVHRRWLQYAGFTLGHVQEVNGTTVQTFWKIKE